MLPWLLAAFIMVPIAEIAVFVEVGGRWGLWPTLAAIFATAIAGTTLIRQQGLSVLREVQTELDGGRFPARQVFDGFCLLIAGALLLTPGFITDGVGFILLIPVARQFAAAGILSRLNIQAGEGAAPHFHGDGVIDGEFRDITEPGPSSNTSPGGDETDPKLPPR